MRVLNASLDTTAQLVSAARFDGEPGWKHPSRVLDTFVLIVGRKGCAKIIQDGTCYQVRPGQALLLFAGVPHQGAEPAREPLGYDWCHFILPNRAVRYSEGQIIRQAATVDGLSLREIMIPEFVTCPDPDRIFILFNELLDSVNGGLSYYSQLGGCYSLSRLLIELSEQALSAARDTSGENHDARFKHVLAWMAAHAGERITADSISREAGYSTDYLCRKIRQYTGLSTSEYLTALRMKIARELLATTDLPIKAIAWKSGYADEKRFMHQFKKTEKITPTQYRNAFDNIRMNL